MDLVRKKKMFCSLPLFFFPNLPISKEIDLFSLEISGFFIIFIIFISQFQALGSWEGKEGRARAKNEEGRPQLPRDWNRLNFIAKGSNG